jgi:hypothetical protein
VTTSDFAVLLATMSAPLQFVANLVRLGVYRRSRQHSCAGGSPVAYKLRTPALGGRHGSPGGERCGILVRRRVSLRHSFVRFQRTFGFGHARYPPDRPGVSRDRRLRRPMAAPLRRSRRGGRSGNWHDPAGVRGSGLPGGGTAGRDLWLPTTGDRRGAGPSSTPAAAGFARRMVERGSRSALTTPVLKAVCLAIGRRSNRSGPLSANFSAATAARSRRCE